MPYGQTTIAASATQLTTNGAVSGYTTITALSTNTEAVWLGDDSSVATTTGDPIYPGQKVTVPRSPFKNWLISASGSQKVGFTYG